MKFTVWHSSESFADYIIDHTILRECSCQKRKLLESDASKPKGFHAVPDHLKKVLYLDAPDIVIELDNEPILSIEISKEAMTGHDPFQRFSRIAAAAENGIASFCIFPEAVAISRNRNQDGESDVKWDVLNPLIFNALRKLEDIFRTPTLMFFYPSHYPNVLASGLRLENKGLKDHPDHIRYPACPAIDDSMRKMFACINELVETVRTVGPGNLSERLLNKPVFTSRREWRDKCWFNRSAGRAEETMSPLSAVRLIPTSHVVEFIRKKACVNAVNGLLPSRSMTAVYCANASFRGDPYAGAITAIDYLKCRDGPTFEDRCRNLVMAWGRFEDEADGISLVGEQSVENFCCEVRNLERRNLLSKTYATIKRKHEIPRYYMQARYGSMFTRSKHIRVYSYFCDAILFPDGALWREG